MKLAEALNLRADCRTRLVELKERLSLNAQVQEGDSPAEDPEVLLEEFERVATQFQRLIQQINKTNSAMPFKTGMTITDAIALRDVLGFKYSAYRELAKAATVTGSRYSKSEIKFRSSVNVADIQKKADAYSRDYRKLDSDIQAVNWLTELVE